MDHDQPVYRQNGVIATLGESLRYDVSGPGLAGGTKVYGTSGNQWFEPGVSYASVIQQGYHILAYQSRSFETYLYYDGHDGHDFAIAGKALAAAGGRVVFKGDYGNALGRVVEIYHPQGYLTRYAHLASFDSGIEVGTQAIAGQPIGTIGGSAVVGGKLTDDYWGPHLHFSVFRWTGGEWHITDPFGWDPWAGPDQQSNLEKQREDPLLRCNGEVSYNLWAGGWPQPVTKTVAVTPFYPPQDRYIGGWLGEEAETKAPETQPVPLTIHGVNYKTKDVGEGWIEGKLHLGFENTSDEPLPPLCLIFDKERAEMGGWSRGCPEDSILIEEVYVETAEGKTYPAEVSPPAIEIGDLALNLPVLPHVPFRHIEIIMGYVFDTVQFRFAQAAHPTALVLKGPIEFRVDLTNVPPTLPQPDFSHATVEPISELTKEPLLKPGGNVQGTFAGFCVHKYFPGFYQDGIALPYTLVNPNSLDKEPYEMHFSHAIYYPGGLLRYFIDFTDATFNIGPGQTEQGQILLFDADADPDNDEILESEDSVRASHLFVFTEDGRATVYELDCSDEQ
ncbi:MAG: M23 family metallopeptidase [Caldilineaceae bacterium]|nr:M23 family metallopeptidase [Caldilineaceae bacterium]